jgi:hypothetical protein
MPRVPCAALAACVQLLLTPVASVADPGAAGSCSQWRSLQFAEVQTCVNTLLLPGGKPATEAMLDAIPETYPWLFPFKGGGPAPQQTIKIKGAADGFSTLQFINGWAKYDTSGAESSQFRKFSRVKDILIETGSGHSVMHTLSDSEQTQFVTLPEPLAKDSVSIKVLSVYPGESETVALRWFSIVWEEGQ